MSKSLCLKRLEHHYLSGDTKSRSVLTRPHPIGSHDPGHHPPQSSHVRIRVLVIQWCSSTPTRTCQRHQKELQLYSLVPWEELKGDLWQRDNYSYYRCTSSGIYIIKKSFFVLFLSNSCNWLQTYWSTGYHDIIFPPTMHRHDSFFPHEASPI
jgi:hypothetical protein